MPSGEIIGYSLSDDLSAAFHYARSLPIDRADSQTLRGDDLSAFSTRPDRDVLGVNMSWRLAGSTFGIAYELQTTRPGAGTANVASLPFVQGSEETTHAFTFGLTRRWGASVQPARVGPMVEPRTER